MGKHWSEYPYSERKMRRRWNWTARHWWKPIVERNKLSSGSYGGWHLWWGPIHAWNVTTHNKTKSRGLTWR
jgi:hypothetical protein